MISVTPEAKVELRKILDRQFSDEATAAQMAVRLIREEASRFSLTFDQLREGDQVVKDEERKVLVADPGVAEAAADMTLDVVEAEGKRKLTLRH